MNQVTVKEAMEKSKSALDWVLQSHILLSKINDYNSGNAGNHDPLELIAQRDELIDSYVEPEVDGFCRYSLDLKIPDGLDNETRQAFREIGWMLSSNYNFFANWVVENKHKLGYAKIA